MTTKPKLRIGLIGTGFMGKAHVFGFTSAPRVFELPFDLELHTVADITDEAAERARQTLGFAHATSDWRTIMANPDIDLVSITAPNALHKEMSLAAIAAGKHVYCEKPLAPLAADALDMTLAAEARGVKTQVGFNYLCNPMLSLARDMIVGGELGEIRGYRGIHCEDYMADPVGNFTFRHDPAGGGALADIGSHALATAEFLCGPVTRVMGDLVTMISERPDGQRWDGMQYADPKAGTGVLFAFRGKSDEESHVFTLKGLDPAARYRLTFEDASSQPATFTGAELMQNGVTVKLAEKESSELVFILRQ